DSIGVAGDTEECSLSKRQRPAITPDQAQTEGDEHPDKKVDRVADSIAVTEHREHESARQYDRKQHPEGRSAADGLRAFKTTKQRNQASHGHRSVRSVRAARSRRGLSAARGQR